MKSLFIPLILEHVLIFIYKNRNMYSLHDVLFGTLVASKKQFGAFPTSPNVLSTLLPNDCPFEKIYKISQCSQCPPM